MTNTTADAVPSIAYEDAYWRERAVRAGIPFTGPGPTPCATCPWRRRYARSPNPKFYDCATTLAQTWEGGGDDGRVGAKHGVLVFCHRNEGQGDLRSLVRGPDSYQMCAASTAVQQRESIRFHEGEACGVDEAPAVRIAQRMGVPPDLYRSRVLTRADLVARAHQWVGDDRIGHPALRPVAPGEFDAAPLDRFVFRLGDLTREERARLAHDPAVALHADGTATVAASSVKVASEVVRALVAQASD